MRINKMIVLFMAALLASCAKDDTTFSLKTIRLNNYARKTTVTQKLHLEVFDDNKTVALASTDLYPSDLTLPASFRVDPAIPMSLYKKAYHVQLWGDSTGYIAGCDIHMDEYKIVFPIDMEVKNDSLNISIMGSWK